MDPRFDCIIETAVLKAKEQRRLLWADQIARHIANASPLTIDHGDLAMRLAREAAFQGVAVCFGGDRAAEHSQI